MFEKLRERRAVSKFKRSTVGMALEEHTHSFFNKTMLRGMSAEAKKKRAEQFYERIFKIPTAENPFLAYRQELGNAAYTYAEFQVLVLKPEELVDLFSSPYISGELYLHLRDCAKHNDWIERMLWEHPKMTDQDLYDVTNAHAVLCLYHLNGLNIVRGEFEHRKLKDPKDWFKPLVKSALIFYEDWHRTKLGLPRLCADDIFPLRHSGFVNIVQNGHEQPLFEWERTTGMVHTRSS